MSHICHFINESGVVLFNRIEALSRISLLYITFSTDVMIIEDIFIKLIVKCACIVVPLERRVIVLAAHSECLCVRDENNDQ